MKRGTTLEVMSTVITTCTEKTIFTVNTFTDFNTVKLHHWGQGTICWKSVTVEQRSAVSPKEIEVNKLLSSIG